MAANYEMTKPTVNILYSSDAPLQMLQQLQYGLEEEGIPWVLDTKSGSNALDLAWEAAEASRLSVGIGLDGVGLVLHFSKLPKDKPLFQLPAKYTAVQARILGANAARLVKKLPLKPI